MPEFKSITDLFDHARHLRCAENVQTEILVGMSTCGRASGAGPVYDALLDQVRESNADGVAVKKTGCVGLCHAEPLVAIHSPGARSVLGGVGPEDAGEIVDIAKNYPDKHHPCKLENCFDGQVRIVLRNSGMIDPENIDDYIATGGYLQLARVLSQFSSEDVIRTVQKSGLRGRGGGGFPTGKKWENARAAAGTEKYIICNADEGDPGAFMDRSVLEGDPHSVLESMAIAAYAVGAGRGYIYVRAEYPLAIKNLQTAIDRAREHRLLGEDILGSGFSFELEVRLGAGAFVCGEETALINSIHGRRGEPITRPPYPTHSGLWGRPTVVNNVETLANIAPIIEKGSGWFRSIGTERSPGTKVFALAGDVSKVGLIEVPLGTSIGDVIYGIGGGSRSGGPVKAVQTGGPSGGCVPGEKFETPIDYENLTELGSMMGSGGMIALEESTSMVELARFYLGFTCDESCGKCVPCRIGTRRLLQLLDGFVDGDAGEGDADELEKLGTIIKNASLCGLGRTAPNPVLSTLRWYGNEYDRLIGGERAYRIIQENCTGCGACVNVCPADCIEGEKKQPHTIVRDDCVLCGRCMEACKFDAVKNFQSDACKFHT